MPKPPTLPPEKGVKVSFRSLRHRNYRLFFFGQGVSLIGTWMQQTAMGWLVYHRTNSAFLLGLVGFSGQCSVSEIARPMCEGSVSVGPTQTRIA